MKLKIEHEFLEHPYADEPGSKGEVWSKIKLYVIDGEGNLVRTVLDWQWDIIVFLDWFIENENALRHEIVPDALKSPSIAKGIYSFYRKLKDPIDMGEIEKVFAYREKHELRFALRGTDTDNICLGLNNDGATISLHNKKDRWNYNVDIEDFFKEIHKVHREIKSYIL